MSEHCESIKKTSKTKRNFRINSFRYDNSECHGILWLFSNSKSTSTVFSLWKKSQFKTLKEDLIDKRFKQTVDNDRTHFF